MRTKRYDSIFEWTGNADNGRIAALLAHAPHDIVTTRKGRGIVVYSDSNGLLSVQLPSGTMPDSGTTPVTLRFCDDASAVVASGMIGLNPKHLLWLYQPIEHPLCSHLFDCNRPDLPRLVDAIAPLLPRDCPVVDVGCQVGYVASQLAAQGFDATGVDSDRRIDAAARALWSFGWQPYARHLSGFERWTQTAKPGPWSAVLLSYIHHFVRRSVPRPGELHSLLSWLSCSCSDVIVEFDPDEAEYEVASDDQVVAMAKACGFHAQRVEWDHAPHWNRTLWHWRKV